MWFFLELMSLAFRLLRGVRRWATSPRPAHDRRLRIGLVVVVLGSLTTVVVVLPLLLILVLVGFDPTMLLTGIAVACVGTAGFVSVVRLRSRQISSIDMTVLGPDEAWGPCSVCGKPRQRLAFLRTWRYCPRCEAPYCQDCRGLLWTLECQECSHEWSIPMD